MEGISLLLSIDDFHKQNLHHPEVKRIQYNVEKTIKTTFDLLGKVDQRLKLRKLHGVGSYYDRTKVFPPDEFDYLIELSDFGHASHFCIHPASLGPYRETPLKAKHSMYRKIELLDEELINKWKDDACVNVGTSHRPRYLLDQIEVKNVLWFALGKVWNELLTQLPRGLEAPNSPELGGGPSLKIDLVWKGRKFPFLVVSVDLALAIHIEDWPEAYGFHRLYPADHFLTQTLTQLVDTFGHHLVPYVDHEAKLPQLCWRVSSSLVENRFFSSMHDQHPVKCLFRDLKVIKERYFQFDELGMLPGLRHHNENAHSKSTAHDLLSSYHIKQLVLHLVAENEPEFWEQDFLVEKFLHTLNLLFRVFQKEDLFDFFSSSHKLSMPDAGNKCVENFNIILEDLQAACADAGYPDEVFEKMLTYMPAMDKACAWDKARQHTLTASLPHHWRKFVEEDRKLYCELPRGQCYDEHMMCPARRLEMELAIWEYKCEQNPSCSQDI